MSFRLGLISLSASSALVTAVLAAQQHSTPWQSLNNPTAAEVAAQWKMPPSEYGPEPYYGLNGPVTIEVVQRDLDRMRQMGFRAVTVQYGAGSGRDYLSAEYLAFFRQLVQEARKRDMRVWIVDDAGYPSGFAGGKFTTEHPELRMQALAATQKLPLADGAKLSQPVSPATVAVTALHAGDGRQVQIPVVNGKVDWQAEGDGWTAYIVEHLFRTSPTRSDTNPKRTKDGSQSLEDYLDPAATAQYLAFTHEAYKKVVDDEFGKTILGFRGDEPDYSISGLPWTPKFFSVFEAQKGYDVRPWLATFLQGPDAPLSEEQLRVKADYYDVFAALFRDGFFKPQADWCAANHLEYQTHLNHEERQLELARSEGDFFRAMRYVQLPGVDAIWHQIWTDTISDFPRFASSAAHLYGHPRAFTESFAAYRPAPDIAQARYILNEQFVRGINLVEVMYFPATSGGVRTDRKSVMDDAGFPALMEYSSRLGFLMSQGHPAAEVALLLPAESLWMGSAKSDDLFVSTERMLSERQVDFDIIDEDAIRSLLPLDQGRFASASGNRYQTVIVPAAVLLPEAVLERLKRFSATGGKTIFLGAAPAWIGTKNNLRARKVTEHELDWAAIIPGELPVVPTPPAQPPTAAPAPMQVPDALWRAVAQNLPANRAQLEVPSEALRIAERKLKDATVYLLFNESAAEFSGKLKIPAPSHARVEQWDAQTAHIAPAVSHKNSGGVEVPLQLAPYQTQVLVVR